MENQFFTLEAAFRIAHKTLCSQDPMFTSHVFAVQFAQYMMHRTFR